jgi:hypothetical protein
VDSDSPVAFGGATSNLDGISESNGARIIVMRAWAKSAGSVEVHTLVLISSAVVTIQFARAVIVENGANGMTSWAWRGAGAGGGAERWVAITKKTVQHRRRRFRVHR